jgi:hypothetical protein
MARTGAVTGRMLRPKAVVLSERDRVPEGKFISPPPNQFTHTVRRRLPFSFGGARRGSSPDGMFPVGTQVVVLKHDGGPQCWIADERGLYAEVAYRGLAKLRGRSPRRRSPGTRKE